jgi:hypothetical protein
MFNVRFGPFCGLKSDIREVPIVLQKSPAKLWNRSLKRSNRAAWIFDQHCALAPDLESILRAPRHKIVLPHNLPTADSCTAARVQLFYSPRRRGEERWWDFEAIKAPIGTIELFAALSKQEAPPIAVLRR